MNAHPLRTAVAELFAPLSSAGPRTSRVAVEQELFVMGFFPGSSVGLDRVREVIEGRPYAAWVSFEPGGQVELSLPPAAGPAEAAAHLVEATEALAADLMAHGLVLSARPVRACDPNTPRYLRTPRYDAMEAHLDTIGPAGRRMMRATTSTQICLDWWHGPAGLEQWRLLNLAGPFLAAATARSTGPTGRLSTWLEVDPSRTAFDDRLLHGDDPVATYAEFAQRATRFVEGTEAHLSTLFPPVRPRGSYLEVRFLDTQRAEDLAPILEGFATLVYDDEVRRRALASLVGEQHRLAALWQAAAAGTLPAERGRALLGLDRALPVAA